jgi:hypothetical protein
LHPAPFLKKRGQKTFFAHAHSTNVSETPIIIGVSSLERRKFSVKPFNKWFVGSKGKALGRTPQGAKLLMIRKAQEGRPNSVWS